MAGLIFQNGELLFVNGDLAFCETDCCYGTPPPCDDCCTKLVGGEWVPADGSDPAHFLFVSTSETSADTIEVKVSGILQDRLICHDQEIVISAEYIHHDAEGSDNGHGASEANHEPYITWDRAWEYQMIEPSAGTGDTSYPHGMIKFGEDTDIHQYEITFKFNACYVDSGTQYGAIDIVWQNEDIDVEIRLTDCPSAYGDCCIPEFACEPCCYYIPLTDGETNIAKTEIVYWAEDNGVRVRLAFVVDSDDRVIYCKDDGGDVIVKVDVIPPPEYTAGHEPEFCIFWQGWWLGTFPDGTGEPPCAPEADADCNNENWHTYGEGWSVTRQFVTPGCDHPCQEDPRDGLVLELGLEGSGSTGIKISTGLLEECPGLCCCDQYVPCCSTCFFPIGEDAPSPGEMIVGFDDGAPSKIEDLTAVINGNFTLTQVGESRHAYEERDLSVAGCPEEIENYSVCYWLVDMEVTEVEPGYESLLGSTALWRVHYASNPNQSGNFWSTFGETGGVFGSFGIEGVGDVVGVEGEDPCAGSIELTHSSATVTFSASGGIAFPFAEDEMQCNFGFLELLENGEWRKATTADLPSGFTDGDEGEEF